MLSLTFGEQVKIILSRKGMTIKELAEIIEERTGKKMSRQNLTQRLGRDNFQEQDMRMIADILGCPFRLSILETAESVERASEIEEILPTEKELLKLAKKKEERERKQEAKQTKRQEIPEEQAVKTAAEREITIGELVDIHEELDAMEQKLVKEPEEKERKTFTSRFRNYIKPIGRQREEARQSVKPEPKEESVRTEEPQLKYTEEPKNPVEEGTSGPQEVHETVGEINPYTGREYETNSVRMHPKRIGYVQVYDQKEHKWTDMTEWAFLGYQERKKALLGKEYKPPIYLD